MKLKFNIYVQLSEMCVDCSTQFGGHLRIENKRSILIYVLKRTIDQYCTTLYLHVSLVFDV